MSIETWAVIWKIVLILGIVLFAVLSVLVTGGGARNIRDLIRKLKEESDPSAHPGSDSDED